MFPISGAGRGAGMLQVGSQRNVWNTDWRRNPLKAVIQDEEIRKHEVSPIQMFRAVRWFEVCT